MGWLQRWWTRRKARQARAEKVRAELAREIQEAYEAGGTRAEETHDALWERQRSLVQFRRLSGVFLVLFMLSVVVLIVFFLIIQSLVEASR